MLQDSFSQPRGPCPSNLPWSSLPHWTDTCSTSSEACRKARLGNRAATCHTNCLQYNEYSECSGMITEFTVLGTICVASCCKCRSCAPANWESETFTSQILGLQRYGSEGSFGAEAFHLALSIRPAKQLNLDCSKIWHLESISGESRNTFVNQLTTLQSSSQGQWRELPRYCLLLV